MPGGCSNEATYVQHCYAGCCVAPVIGRKLFEQVDQTLNQAFPHCAGEALGGCSCLLVGDFG